MDRISLAFARILFFVLLFISTACNKLDKSLLRDEQAEARPAVVAEQASVEASRLRELEGRVALLEAELKAVNSDALASLNIPGGANWD